MSSLLYLEMGPIPIHVGITADEKAYWREMKRLGVNEPNPFTADSHAASTHILALASRTRKSTTCIITVNPTMLKSRDHTCALLAHEATHVAQACWESMGETKPGDEIEAYLVQYIVLYSIQHLYGRTR